MELLVEPPPVSEEQALNVHKKINRNSDKVLLSVVFLNIVFVLYLKMNFSFVNLKQVIF